jgi:hypothetical protein
MHAHPHSRASLVVLVDRVTVSSVEKMRRGVLSHSRKSERGPENQKEASWCLEATPALRAEHALGMLRLLDLVARSSRCT